MTKEEKLDIIIKLLEKANGFLRTISNSTYVEKSHGDGTNDELPE